jgi:phytoene dehydrogenase-like protein
MVFLWNINKSVPKLAQHNIFFSSDYQREFEQMFRDKIPAEDPTIYIAITCRQDKAHAPAGSENWFVLVNMPYITDQQNWPDHVNWVRKQIVNRLENSGIHVADHIEEETVFTPESFFNTYGANRGSIYGLSSNSRFSAFLRPPNRSRDINGLYFASGSTHPGGGIPLVLLSGKLTAEMIQENLNTDNGRSLSLNAISIVCFVNTSIVFTCWGIYRIFSQIFLCCYCPIIAPGGMVFLFSYSIRSFTNANYI